MKIVILILARGGSKSVPKKNIRELNGKPLLAYVLDEAKKLEYPVYVSTEDPEIAKIAKGYGANVIPRPSKLAQDNSKSIDAVQHAERLIKADYIVLLSPCTPFLKAEDIQACVDIALETKCDSVVSLVEDFSSHPSKLCHLIDNKVMPINTSYSFQTSTRQEQVPIFKRNTAIYMASRATIKKGTFFGKDTRGYVMSPERSIDINSMWDFLVCELIMKHECSL